MSKNIALTYLGCFNNQLTATALDALFGTLHSNTFSGYQKYINVNNNPGTTTCNQSIVTNKGWTVINT